ncbi:DUF2267 domain-containing protein [Gandjariella thermophila]|uniref:DUF2267 domain-containing protein n=1 Tax=Gandjariella thermophila TaxID=1931992 RepID=A0A4D4J9W0_9PSEU|nr:DUF2267 domain-containing protein [Gandjariella thermophila]GDY32082.1 hypothetical protein GTS_37150 [Gandjariella thermophila]
MRHDEFVGQVQARARLASRGEAERATRATLETLAERIPGELADNVASQLPEEIGEHLRRVAVRLDEAAGERFGLNEFIARVSERSGEQAPQAAYTARVVLEVVGEATTGVLPKIRQSLPADVQELVEAGSSGRME